MSEHSPLIVVRFMNPYAQADLAHRVSKLAGLELTEPGLELLSHGEAGLELITEQQYGKALSSPKGKLKKLDGVETRDIIHYHLNDIRQAPTESKVLVGETEPTEGRTRGTKSIIYYPVQIPELVDENERAAHVLDELNSTDSINWGRLHPRLVVAVVPRRSRQVTALKKAFEAARPERAVLMGAKVVQSQELAINTQIEG